MRKAALKWPPAERLISDQELSARAARCLSAWRQCLIEQRIHVDLDYLLKELYLPLADWLGRRAAGQRDALVVGLCGAQGSGKTTVSRLLSAVLRHGFGTPVAAFSLDDLYLTRERRQSLAREQHPLFAIRGVPGTHDVELGIRLIQSLRGQRAGETTRIPVFDKARDDRRPEAEWRSFEGPAEVILFEGWCVGARPQAETDLATPVNALERDEDPGGVWRTAVNRALAGPYQSLFDLLDVLVLLEVQSMTQVLKWRRLQEHKLRQACAGQADLKIMSATQIERFVMHFERLTRHILAEMPARADIVLGVDGAHQVASIRIKRRPG